MGAGFDVVVEAFDDVAGRGGFFEIGGFGAVDGVFEGGLSRVYVSRCRWVG